MSATGLDVFDKTLQTTNGWLGEINAMLGPGRQLAWKVLSRSRGQIAFRVSAASPQAGLLRTTGDRHESERCNDP
jgi:hypothetical protein